MFERSEVENQNILLEHVQQLSIRRDLVPGQKPEALIELLWEIKRLGYLFLLQIDHYKLGFLNLVAVNFLDRGPQCSVDVFALRIGRGAQWIDMAIAFVEIEVARDFSRREVDHFDSHLRSENEQLLPVLSEHDLQRGAGFEFDLVDHLLLRFIDDQDLVGPGAEVHQRSGGPDRLLRVSRLSCKKQDRY